MQQPGPIASSPNYDSNYTQFMNVDTVVYAESITDGYATLKNGILSNLNDPTHFNDAVTKEYVDISSQVSNPLTSIQYNVGGQPFASFGSTSSLTFNENTNTMYSSRTKIGNLILGSGTITNLNNPINLTDAVPKTYVDNFFVTNYHTISSSSTTLSAIQMVNSILISSSNSSTVTLTTASASSIIALASIVGATFTFTLVNSGSGHLVLVPGSGVTIVPQNLNIYSGYTLSSYIIIGSNEVSIYVTGLSYTNGFFNNLSMLTRSTSTIAKNTTVTDQYTFNTNSIYINSLSGHVYMASQLSGIIYRSGNTLRIDKLDSVVNCISGNIYGAINYIFSTGAIEFVIKNTATGTGNNVILASGSGWSIDSNSNMTIPPGYSGYFYLYINTTNVTGNIYTIGIMPH